jgi:CPA2 family monovalent cation:H+ antiporter-2
MKYDEAAMHHLAPHRHDTSDYISNAREQIRLQEQLLASDRASSHSQNDHAWDTNGPVPAAEESGLHQSSSEKAV